MVLLLQLLSSLQINNYRRVHGGVRVKDMYVAQTDMFIIINHSRLTYNVLRKERHDNLHLTYI